MRDLLDPLAPEVDVDAGWASVADRIERSGRRRRRTQRALAVAALVALVGGGVALASRGGDDPDRRIDTVPATPEEPEPAGLPSGWHRATEILTPDLTDPREVVTVATGPLLVEGPGDCGRAPGRSLRAMGPDDALVWVAAAGPTGADTVPDLVPVVPSGPPADPSIPDCVGRQDLDLLWRSFGEDGERYYLLVALAPTASDRTRAETLDILRALARDGVDALTPRTAELPEGWQEAERILTPNLGEGPGREWEAFAAGTYPLQPNGPGARCAQWPVTALEQLGPEDALVWAIRPTGHTPYPPRPPELGPLPTGPASDSVIPECLRIDADFAFDTYRYEEDGQNVIVLVALGLDADARTRAEALDVLNGLDVTDRATTTVADVTVTHPAAWPVEGVLAGQGSGADPRQVLAVGSYYLRADPPCEGDGCAALCGSWPIQAVRDLGPSDVLVWVAEASPATAAVANAPDRPVFDALPTVVDRSCDQVDTEARTSTFFDEGRLLTVYVVLGDLGDRGRRAEAIAILNSLELDPAS